MDHRETEVSIRPYQTTEIDEASIEFQNDPLILRLEDSGWLEFNTNSYKIRNLGELALDQIELPDNVVRVVENDSIEGAMSAPLKLFMSLSNRCNLTCDHCMSASSPHGSLEQNIEDLKQMSDEAAEMGVFMIVIGGGEPLIYRGLWDLISHQREQNLGVTLTTNALLVKDSDIDNILKFNVKTNVSIDGMAKTHDRIRNRPGAFHQTMNNINRMIAKGIRPILRYTLMNSNMDDVEPAVEMANDLGLPIKVKRAKPSGRVLEGSEIITEPSEKYFELIMKLNQLPNCGIEDLMSFDGTSKDDLLLSSEDCGAGTRLAFIDEDGTITPCTYLGPEFISGSWEPGKLKETWKNNEKFIQMRNLNPNEECSSCARHSDCHNECPAMRLHAGGSLDAQDPGCIKPLVEFLGATITRKANV